MIKIMKYGEVSADEIFARGKTSFDVADIVTDIIENVKANGDKALFHYCEKFDEAKLSSLELLLHQHFHIRKVQPYKQAVLRIFHL